MTTDTLNLPAPVTYVRPEYPVFGVGPCSMLAHVQYSVTEGWGDDKETTHGYSTVLGLTPDGAGKWKLYAGSTADGTPKYWDISGATALEAFIEAWDEVGQEEYITSYQSYSATAFTLGKL